MEESQKTHQNKLHGKLKIILTAVGGFLVVAVVLVAWLYMSAPLTIAKNGKTNYVIVVSDVDDECTTYANLLSHQIRVRTGVYTEVVTDASKSGMFEIIVGKNTNRTDLEKFYQNSTNFDFQIVAKGRKIFIISKSNKGVSKAVDYILANFVDDEQKTVILPAGINYFGAASEWLLHVTETEIIVPGLTKEYKFMHITDTHFTIVDNDESQEIKDVANERRAVFANESGVYTEEIFGVFMDYVGKMKPDAILLSGDIVDFPSAGNISFISNKLNASDVDYLYALGNHDWSFAKNYWSNEAKEENFPKFAPIMNNNPTFQVLEYDDLIIVALDNTMNNVSADQVEDFKTEIAKGKPIIVMFHVPYSDDTLIDQTISVWGKDICMPWEDGKTKNDPNKQLYNLISDLGNNVITVISGHLHFNHEDRLSNGPIQYITAAGTDGSCRLFTIKGE